MPRKSVPGHSLEKALLRQLCTVKREELDLQAESLSGLQPRGLG